MILSYVNGVLNKIISLLKALHGRGENPNSIDRSVKMHFGKDAPAILDAMMFLLTSNNKRNRPNVPITQKINTMHHGQVTIELLYYTVKQDTGIMRLTTQFTVTDSNGKTFTYFNGGV